MLEIFGDTAGDEQGIRPCTTGGVFDASYITSKTRRGRYQEGLCPTLTANQTEIYLFEDVYEQEDNRDRAAE